MTDPAELLSLSHIPPSLSRPNKYNKMNVFFLHADKTQDQNPEIGSMKVQLNFKVKLDLTEKIKQNFIFKKINPT